MHFRPTKLRPCKSVARAWRRNDLMRPVGANFVFVFRFSAMTAFLFPSAKFSNRYALISEPARFLALFLVLTPYSPPVRSTNLHEASSIFVLVRTNSNYSSWQILCRDQSSTETLFPIKNSNNLSFNCI